MGYQAGNLELSLLGYSDKAVNSINATTKALRSLSNVIKKMESVNFSFAGQKLEALFTKIARATNSINTTNITNLASAAKSLSSITRLSNLEKMDFEKVGKGFNTLAVAIQPFLDKVKEAEASLTALDGVLRRSSGRKIQGLLGGGATDNKSGGFLGFAKLGISLHLMRRMGRFMENLVQAGSDYNETLNLWQVAMRNNLDVADQFVNKMQKAYGISTKTLMNAQAIFKNMIGSLGQISDATAYALSEALVQMSADFASLYNVTIESAFQKMQAMLAGQVRPIRSAGLDMTETTLFMFYQQLGGTKTMRQLNRTEKQLLSILAVYEQMGKAGALGDMTKTLNQFANQSRMMTEYWAELKTWSGLLLKDLIEDWGILVKINALLITATEVVKAIAKSRGVGDENYLTGMFETADATNDEVDELQGKLLDFDKFRSLEGASASTFAIDEKLLQAITGYSSKIDQAENEANKLAKEWLIALGATKDASGELTFSGETLDGIVANVKSVFGLVSSISSLLLSINITKSWIASGLISFLAYAYTTNEKFRESINTLVVSLSKTLVPILNSAADILSPILNVLSKVMGYIGGIVSKAEELGVLDDIIYMIIAAIVVLNVNFSKSLQRVTAFGKVFKNTWQNGIILAITAAVGAFALFDGWISSLSGTAKTVVSVLAIVFGSLAAILGVIIAIKEGAKYGLVGAIMAGVGVGAVIAGIKGVTSKEADAMKNIPMHANGASDIDGGTLFVAGEMGKTEAVYTGGNGKTNVANVQQMKAAFYQALVEYGRTSNADGRPIEVYLDGERVYQNTTAHAKRRGNVWSKA